MNKQMIFDVVLYGIRAQGGPSMMNNSASICAYRGEQGRRCAVGLWISDEVYTPAFEYKNLQSLLDQAILSKRKLPSWFHEQVRFLQELQKAHDTSAIERANHGADFFELWEQKMRDLALMFNLRYTAPDMHLDTEVVRVYENLQAVAQHTMQANYA